MGNFYPPYLIAEIISNFVHVYFIVTIMFPNQVILVRLTAEILEHKTLDSDLILSLCQLQWRKEYFRSYLHATRFSKFSAQ